MPVLEILELRQARGVTLPRSEPYIPKIPALRHYAPYLASVPLSAVTGASFDGVKPGADHDCFEYGPIIGRRAGNVDARGRFLRRSGIKRVRA